MGKYIDLEGLRKFKDNLLSKEAVIGTVDIQELDSFGSSDVEELMSILQGDKPMRYIVTNKILRTYVAGIMDMFSDDMGHVLTQVLHTHYQVNADGKSFGSHTDATWRTYSRSFNHNAPNIDDIEPMTWGPWREAYRYPGEIRFMGVATPDTVPSKPEKDREMCYIATEAGTYSHFTNVYSETCVVNEGEVALLVSVSGQNGSATVKNNYKKQTIVSVNDNNYNTQASNAGINFLPDNAVVRKLRSLPDGYNALYSICFTQSTNESFVLRNVNTNQYIHFTSTKKSGESTYHYACIMVLPDFEKTGNDVTMGETWLCVSV